MRFPTSGWIILAAIVLFPALASAQSLCPGHSGYFIPYAKETLSVGATAVPFTASAYNTASQSPFMAVVTVESASIRAWADGSTPTAAVGVLINTNVFYVCGNAAIRNFLAIATSGTASLSVQYSK